jgi:hypothetical protein
MAPPKGEGVSPKRAKLTLWKKILQFSVRWQLFRTADLGGLVVPQTSYN